MADKKITELPNINGADLVDADEFVVVDISADETKAITLAELKNAFDAGTGFVRVTGDTMTGVLVMPDGTNSAPSISNTGETDTGMFFGAADTVSFTAGGTKRLDINTTGIDVTGNMVVSGTVDGRDVATDGTKLDNIEASADVTDTTNVTAAGALMDSELTNIAAVKALNQGLATTDEVAFDNTSLNAIATDISDTAVDVFVYDTSKDSDGGAWRKRTQNTSWYNEALGTSTRGSRKEFPAVAVLVYEEDQVTIYDGDDPDLPMWMVFNASSSGNFNLLGSTSRTTSALAALNAEFMFCSTNNQNQTYINFITDFGCLIYASGSNMDIYNGNIAERNAQKHYHGGTVNRIKTSIINRNVNDVAMTVLPNAPIDYATGLPVPTIAVATDGGVSVITDSGAVYDITQSTTYNTVREIDFTYNNKIIYTMDNGDSRSARVDSIPSSDFVVTSNQLQQGSGEEFYNGADFGYFVGDLSLNLPTGTSITKVVGSNLNDREIATTNGMTKIALANQSVPSSGMTNFITSSYNTGWQVGDIKLATLSDTDDTNVTGADLAPANNAASVGSEANATTGFESGNTSTFASSSSQAFSGTYSINAVANANSAYVRNSSAVTLEVGKVYTASVAVYVANGDANTGIAVRYGTTNNGALEYGISATITAASWTIYTRTFTATSTNFFIYVGESGAGNDPNYFIDAFSVRLAEEDRSVNGNGFQVFGTVTKTAVATGADLVGYSGFSASNYLQQPYNSSIMPSTNSFCVTGWYNQNSVTPTTSPVLFAIGSSSDTNKRLQCAMDNNNVIVLWTATASGAYTYANTSDLGAEDSVWHCVSFIRQQNGKLSIYRDGVELALAVDTSPTGTIQNINWTDAVTSLGAPNFDTARAFNGSMALWRFSATAPSPEQIAKIYNDEKHLFQTGAQATLYGDSDAVTALAYDDTTDLLHVGTSEGRSVFQGLRRVENTTTAVGATISASNGLVAED